uniref:B1292H11.3 protein n=1 Tax=Oryza sativa subsp. japonica TaxID=39947 RepID=Q6MWC8_ORYSJ|nr:B1292H11.3 [Oryza sativa Japonica Group]
MTSAMMSSPAMAQNRTLAGERQRGGANGEHLRDVTSFAKAARVFASRPSLRRLARSHRVRGERKGVVERHKSAQKRRYRTLRVRARSSGERLGEEVSAGTSAERGRLIQYHMVCTVSAEAPYSPLPVRGLLAVCHEALRPGLPKPQDQRGFKPKTSELIGRSPMAKAMGEDAVG